MVVFGKMVLGRTVLGKVGIGLVANGKEVVFMIKILRKQQGLLIPLLKNPEVEELRFLFGE